MAPAIPSEANDWGGVWAPHFPQVPWAAVKGEQEEDGMRMRFLLLGLHLTLSCFG